jgi:hypothetical protein
MEYSKAELKRSLFTGISLMTRGPQRMVPRTAFGDQEFKWVTFEEIEELRKDDWYLVNNQKRLFYRDYMVGETKKRNKRRAKNG